jgi:hypothetical protein
MRFILSAALLAAIGVTPASATLQIAFGNGASTFTCQDQTACDLDGAAKNLLLLNTFVGDIKIVGTFAASTTQPDELSVSNLTITNLGTGIETLFMAVGDTNFTGPVSFIRASGSGTFNNDVGGSASVSFFASPTNTQPAAFATDLPGTNLFTTGEVVTSAPTSFSGTKDSLFSALGPFSMAEGASLTLLPGASVTGFNESMAAQAIPEPRTWAMLLIGFGLMAFGAFRQRRIQRLAL